MELTDEAPKQPVQPASGKGAIVVAIIAAIGGWGTAAITNWEKISGSAPSGSPFIHWQILSSKIDLPQCGTAAFEALQVASPKKLEAADEEEGVKTRVADFGDLTGWVSCIGSRPNTAIYIGVAGADFSDGKNKSEQLAQLISTRLAALRK
jgi:hypothetical protein